MSKDLGVRNPSAGLALCGLETTGVVRYNVGEAELVELAVTRGEATLTAHGALRALTGQHTGRSAKDKFVVRDASSEDQIWWDNNKPMAPEAFERLHADMMAHARGHDLFVQDLVGGADSAHALPSRIVTEYAWHALFIRNLLIRPERTTLTEFVPELTIINLPSFRADPARHGCRSETVIAVNLAKGLVLIGGTSYAGEMKKSVFTALNYLLPAKNVMPMHCSANAGPDGDTAVFFGLSGTGKTTLSADPARTLIGDDEHGWGEDGVFNFEGGCYAKTIRLSREAEPEIFGPPSVSAPCWRTWFWMKPDPDFDDGSLTENTRCAYPLHFIPNASSTGRAGHPRNIIMLTCDAFGVMPPIAKLTPARQCITSCQATPPRWPAQKRASPSRSHVLDLLRRALHAAPPVRIRRASARADRRSRVNCWLVNTGWTGGAYGVGQRMPIKATRTLLTAALNGSLETAEYRIDPNFGFAVPVAVSGVDSTILDPRSTWADKPAYDAAADRLVGMFIDNFEKFETHVDGSVLSAAPGFKAAAE
jgi:phosphoenolpyruvate carboxykinase (ATP)